MAAASAPKMTRDPFSPEALKTTAAAIARAEAEFDTLCDADWHTYAKAKCVYALVHGGSVDAAIKTLKAATPDRIRVLKSELIGTG